MFHQIQQVLNSQQEVNVRDPSFRNIVEHVPTSRGADYLASGQVKKKLMKETFERFLRKHRQTVKSPPPEFSGGYCRVAALLLGLKWLQLDETKRRKWAPLPYNGQKRRFRSEMYASHISRIKTNFPVWLSSTETKKTRWLPRSTRMYNIVRLFIFL